MDASSQYVWNIRFINEIEKRPGIWNESIKSRDSQKQLWEELSQVFNNKSVDSLKRKYKSLKQKFHQQLGTIPQTNNEYDVDPRSFESDWPHYEQMLFLLNEFEAKKNEKRKPPSPEEVPVPKKKRVEEIVKNLVEKHDGDDDKTSAEKQTELDVHNVSSENMLKEGTSTEIMVRPDILPVPSADDGLYHFLMGLYSSMNELDPIRKINVQARIYAMLSQEVTAAAKK
ncbi:uncharacterized protein LOC119081322 [Bradysia coprophila]|uniref:uncharacterized protein LOC119081322 n=1 Tax=Bradysia coprophila TaxID=38358 RepID=UPI00187D7975|nr:uncharacterized protein LOC119081322 [Bradysia coprophila]